MPKKKSKAKQKIKRRKKRKLGRIEKGMLQAAERHVPLGFDAQVRLGALRFDSMDTQEAFAKRLAEKLKVAIATNGWIQPYEDKEYVKVEGWTMLGALIGVTPVEEYVRPIILMDEEHSIKGYEAKINLLCNGQIVGGASSECTVEESLWAGRDTFALRSMTLTRATSKAFRLNYGWIMALTGYDPTPASDLMNPEKKILLDPVKQAITTGTATTPRNGQTAKVFGVWPPTHNGNKFFIFGMGDQLVDKGTPGIEAYLQQEFKAVFSDKFHSKGGWLIPAEHQEAVKTYLESKGIPAQVPKYATATTTTAQSYGAQT
jgi:hypothetical protein